MPTDLAAAIADVLDARSGVRPTVSSLVPLAGGASRETWAFDAEAGGSRRPLILRRDPPGRPSEPGAMALEARLLDAARAHGLPVPEVLAYDDGSRLGTAGLVMSRVDGETVARRIQRDHEYAAARSRLVGQCGDFLARLHAIDPAAIDGLPWIDPLERYRERWRELDGVNATFELAFRWLDAHRPARRPDAIVHGDFRLGNLIVDGNGLAAVLDWELAHAGDPVEDLAWLCVKAWRFRQPQPVAGIGRVEQLLDAYSAAGGTAIDGETLHWWLVFSTLKWGVICEWQAAAHLTGAHRSVELAAIGRRTGEQEWDLLELLDPQACVAALADAESGGFDEPPADDPEPYGHPTARELLAAVREHLTDEVMPASAGDRPLQFRSRVAANVVSIVQRQLQLGQSQAIRHRRLFEQLGVAGVADLARRVRDGAWDDRGEQLRPALAALARDKLAIAEPRHLTIPIATGDTT